MKAKTQTPISKKAASSKPADPPPKKRRGGVPMKLSAAIRNVRLRIAFLDRKAAEAIAAGLEPNAHFQPESAALTVPLPVMKADQRRRCAADAAGVAVPPLDVAQLADVDVDRTACTEALATLVVREAYLSAKIREAEAGGVPVLWHFWCDRGTVRAAIRLLSQLSDQREANLRAIARMVDFAVARRAAG